MYLQLPVRHDIPSYNFQQELEGTVYDLEFNYNTRGGYWMMDINDASKNPIITGIRVVTDFSLIGHLKVPGAPPGQFIAYDTSGYNRDAGINDFGSKVLLIYRESTTVDEE